MTRQCIFFLALCGAVAGCGKSKTAIALPVSLAPVVKVAQPTRRTIRRSIAQPGAIEPYEQTSIFSKIPGFVEKWKVDIGSRVNKDDLLVQLVVPELAEELNQKKAYVEQDKAFVNQAEKLVRVAESNLQAATDAVTEAAAGVRRYEADMERWQGELSRLSQMVKDRTINPEILAETQNQLKASQAACDSASAGVKTKESQRLAAEAQVEKTKADLNAANAQVKVAEAEQRRVAAMFAYTEIRAPYNGVITARNVDTGDFVLPATGESGGGHDGHSNGHATPLFVIARTDVVMMDVGVPEVDAPYVKPGTKAILRVQALAGREFDASVTRTSLAMSNHARTLDAQIDLPNPNNELIPGMYAYGSIETERPNVEAIPTSALVEIGNRISCYLVRDGKAARTQIQTGICDGNWIEVSKRRTFPAAGEPGAWEDFSGFEEVIIGDLSEVADGTLISVGVTE